MIKVKNSILLTLFVMTLSPVISQISASQQALIDVSENLENGLIIEAKEELSRCNYSNLSRQDKMEFQRLRESPTYSMVTKKSQEKLLKGY
jgi:hypothetical protein